MFIPSLMIIQNFLKNYKHSERGIRVLDENNVFEKKFIKLV